MTTNTNVLDVYKKVVKSGDLQKNPYEVVKLILQELSRTMQILSEDIEKKKQLDIKQHSSDLLLLQKSISKNVTRSLTTIYSLQTSLDFDKGGKIATGLFQLYEYCRVQIISGFTKSINDGIIKAKKALDQILSAWNNMQIKNI
ncbi:MAG: flagellar protein FliS [Candidatus Puniceispirillales bacterium]|jgi:flagellar protein FliS|nr:flagellar protein FliS [Pseudomonadota bacterium]